jgi:RHS repeat-associated protein
MLSGGAVPIIDEIPLPSSGVELKGALSLSAASQFSLFTPDKVPVDYTVKWSIAPMEDCLDCSSQTASGNASVSAENQSLGQAISVTGLPMGLHYQSERAAGRALASKVAIAHQAHLGGLTLGAHHAYDPTLNTLFMGNGNRRGSAALGAVSQTALGQYLVADPETPAVYLFDADGRHLQTRHALTGGVLNRFNYNAKGHLTGISDGDGNLTKIVRSPDDRPTALVGAYGQRTKLSVDSNGNLASITRPGGKTIKLGFDGNGLLTRHTDGRNKTTRYSYDTGGRLLSLDNPAGGSQTWVRHGVRSDNTVTGTSPKGLIVSYRTQRAATAESRTITDAAGLVTTRTDTITQTQTVTTPTGMQTQRSLGNDPRFGRSGGAAQNVGIKTPNGLSLSASTTSTAVLTNPDDPFSLGQLTETVKINNLTYRRSYNGTTKTITDKTPAGRKTVTALDGQGRKTRAQDGNLQARIFSYDTHGRLSGISQGTGGSLRQTQFQYGADGLVASLVDPLGQKLDFTRDAEGRITQLALPGGAANFTYDAGGNLATLQPPKRATHTFSYTADGLLATYSAPAVGDGAVLTRYAYNQDRQFTRVTYPDGNAVSYGYDVAGRLQTRETAQGITDYVYDRTNGHLATVTAPGGIRQDYNYDGDLLTAVAWSGPVNGRVNYVYDNNFHLKSVSVGDDSTVAFAYDKDGLPVKAGDLKLERNAATGLITGTSLGIVTDHWQYNRFGEVVGYTVETNGVPLFELRYNRDRLGRVTTLQETLDGVTSKRDYRYYADGRLSKVLENGVKQAEYRYDANGNRLKATRGDQISQGVYDAQDRLLRYGGTVYQHSAAGVLQSKTANSQTTRYAYDAQGNLLSVTPETGDAIAYLVDGQNRRIGKTVGGKLSQGFLYEASLAPSAELDANGNRVSRFVYATRANVPDTMIRGGQSYRIISDGLGSVRLVINSATGEIVQRMAYDEFGRVLQDSNPSFQPFGYAGGLYDPDTALVHFSARDYDAETGRWTAKDPLLFEGGSFNLYEYAASDPINRTDIDGLDDTAAAYAGNYPIPDTSARQTATTVLKQAWTDVNQGRRMKQLQNVANGESPSESLNKPDVKNPSLKEYKKLVKDADKSKSWVERLAGVQKAIWNACSNALGGSGQDDNAASPQGHDPMPVRPKTPKPFNGTPLKPIAYDPAADGL